ncbi:alpha/beta fold hydrolase [Trichloromonas sp.]|uniref:alpha/beta fold hydrolase n=1 Tax=Trichloromonas sp. TaxID=3069249 RepID=UPI002A4A5621|nr:alpha/beta hydrolase [Trichloromonas sp.]
MTGAGNALIHKLVDGRRLGYAEYGMTEGRPLFYFHGFPGSRLEAALADGAAARLGIRLLALDRPGYGLSDDLPDRRLDDWPVDVAALADALGLKRFDIFGVSGGAPFALACAAAFPERVEFLSLVCPLGPLGAPELYRRLPWLLRLALSVSQRFPDFSKGVGGNLLRLIHRYPEGVLRALLLGAAPQDREVFRDVGVFAAMAQSLREALSQKGRGAVADMAVYHRTWGFPLSALDLPVQLWHGSANLPHCTLHLVPGEGHFSLPLRHMDEILAKHQG